MTLPASMFCPVCHRPRSQHRWTVTRTVSIEAHGCTRDEALQDAAAMPATAWNVDTEEVA